MRISVILETDGDGERTMYAFGTSVNDMMVGQVAHLLSPPAMLNAAVGAKPGDLVFPTGEDHVLVVQGDPMLWRALADGHPSWRAAGKVQAWTRWTSVEHPDCKVWVLLLALAGPDQRPTFMATGDPERACRALLDFGHAVGHPYVINPNHTANMALRRLLIPDKDVKGVRPDRRVEPYWGSGQRGAVDDQAGGDLIWQRPPLRDESGGWVHAYDLNAARLSAMNVVEVARDELEWFGPREFDPTLAGYWGIQRSKLSKGHVLPAGAARLCPPFIDTDRPLISVTTPIMQLWAETVGVPPIQAARVAPGVRLFRSVAERWDKARKRYLAEDDRMIADMKQIYRGGTGLLASPGGLIYRPDWYHAIMDRQRATLYTRMLQVHEQSDRWPLRVHTDCLWYASDTEDPSLAALELGLPIHPERLGHFKIYSSRTFAEATGSKERTA